MVAQTADVTQPERLPPWWMFVVAASYVALLSLIPYIVIWGPADPLGLRASFENGSLSVHSVAADSPFARGGLRAGDQVAAIDSRPIRDTQDWGAVNANLEVGRVQRWEIRRSDELIELGIRTERATWKNRLSAGYITFSALAVCCFAVGLFMAFRRPHDTTARIGAWFIGTASIAFGLPNGWAVVWRQAPMAFQILFWIPELSRFVLDAIFLSLLMIFPRRLSRARWPWILIWAPVLVTLPWRVSQFAAVIYGPSESLGPPTWAYQAINLRTMLYLAAGLGILLVSYRLLLGPSERRRVRVLLAGTAVSLTAGMAIVWQIYAVGWGLGTTLWVAFVHPLTLAAPLAFAYAIIRHRVFDIRVIIRQGLQYAFARGAVLGLVPAMGAILVLDLVLNSHQPLADILQTRGWMYFAIGATAVALFWQRKRWLEAIDRRFFREQYDAERLLGDVIQEVRTARRIERVSLRVASRIEAALHPEFVSLLVREPEEMLFRPLASMPPDRAPLLLPADSKLIALAGVLGKPLEVLLGDSDWLDRRLPGEERDFVRQARIDLLIPITAPPGGRQSLLVLGIRRSEEPYSRKDQELLETIAASLAFLLEQPISADKQPTSPFGIEAPESVASETVRPQSAQGSRRETVSGKVFSHYRVVRQLGKGGMGEVFLAEDTSLDRLVALKFLSGLLQADETARRRLLREAKSAAALDHPFICKIYETGRTELGHDFIAMEYVEGQTLKEKLADGPLSPRESLHVAAQVTDALEIAHKKGIVHRDLKPANIMLTQQGHVKVMDFGLAKRLAPESSSEEDLTANLTREGSTIGTPAYMSPEQIRTEPVDHRSDIFSLGIVLYEMLTGVHPFRRTQALDTMGAILNDEAPLLSEYLPDPGSLMQETVATMLAKVPGQRYETASELAKDLHRVQNGTLRLT